MGTAPAPKRGEVWLVDFDPARGAEIRKARPAVVAGIDTMGRLPLRIVVPITDWKPNYSTYPWFVLIPASVTNSLAKDSGADTFQVKSISLSRFDRRLGNVTAAEMTEISAGIALCVGA